MNYLIYMKRSFKLRFNRHLMLCVILTCAIILPLIISILRDSMIFGQQSFVQQQTCGQTYQVINAKPEYLEYFTKIPGLSSYYEDDTIFINIMSEEDANNHVRKDEYDKTLRIKIKEIKDDRLLLMDMSRFGSDESNGMFAGQLLIVNAFIIVLSLLFIQSSYINHLHKFAPDIGVLVSCGAENRQIRKIFLIEFLFTFMISAISAVAISSVLMYILFQNYLQVKDVGNLSWLIFRIDPLSLMVHLLVFGIAQLLLIIICLNLQLQQTSIKMLRSIESGEKTKHYRKILETRKNSVESLGRLLFHRTKSRFIACLMISVPITIVIIFIFNYLIINIESVSKLPDYEITIEKNAILSKGTEISNDDIEFIKGIDGVKIVKEVLNTPQSKYLIRDARMNGNSLLVIGDDRYAQTFIHLYSEIENPFKSKDFNTYKYNIAISKNHEYLKYKVGDKIYLYINEMGFTEECIKPSEDELNNNDNPHNHDQDIRKVAFMSNPIELTIVQLLDYEWTDRMFPIYFTDEMYQELAKDESVTKLQLNLNNTSDSKEVISILKNKFIGVEYSITNNQEMYEKNKESSMGIYIMALFIFSILFAFILVVLYVKLSDYVETQNNNIRIFYILGASKSDIYDSYMRLPLNVSMLSIIVSFAIGLGLCILFFQNTGYHLILNMTTVFVHLIIAFLILAAFNVPVHSALKRKMKQL